MSDLKSILELLPDVIDGRELSLVKDRDDHYWYIGHPNESGDFSVALHADDRDPEGAALNLLSQFDKAKGEE